MDLQKSKKRKASSKAQKDPKKKIDVEKELKEITEGVMIKKIKTKSGAFVDTVQEKSKVVDSSGPKRKAHEPSNQNKIRILTLQMMMMNPYQKGR